MSSSTRREGYLRAGIVYVPCKRSHIQQLVQHGTKVSCDGQGAALGKGRLLLLAVGKGESLTSCTWGGLPGWAAHWRLTLLTSTCPTHVLHHGDNLLPRSPLQGESWGSPGQSPLQLPQASGGIWC